MPVYVRKHQTVDPPDWEDLQENDDDYLQDPELLRDQLPQPYRMINEFLYDTFDDIWLIIAKREEERLAEEARYKAPKFGFNTDVQLVQQTYCLADSIDGRIMFAGLSNGIAAVNSQTTELVCLWPEEGMTITSISVALIGVQTYLIPTIDDTGLGRLFGFYNDAFYLLKIMNEQDSGTKVLATKLQPSKEGDYLAAALENAQTHECSVEVFKLPRDVWLREFEAIAPNKALQENQEEEKKEDIDDKEANASESRPGSADTDKSSAKDRKDYKFSPPSLVLKVKSPSNVSGCHLSSTQSGVSRADMGDVIGAGCNHMLTVQNLQSRKAMFDVRHEQHLQYMRKESPVANFSQPTLHFVTAGRLLPSGLEMKEMQDRPCSLAVWWTGGSQVCFYPLLKQAKDLEIPADVVWPFGAKIVRSTVCSDSRLLVVITEKNSLTAWDLHTGMVRRTLLLATDARVISTHILSGNDDRTQMEYPPYRERCSSQVLVACDDGSMYLIDITRGSRARGELVIPPCDRDEDIPTLVEPFYGLNYLLLVCRTSGAVEIVDLHEGRAVASVQLPAGNELTSPWEPVLALGAQSHVLYFGANKIKAKEDDACEKDVDELEVQEQASETEVEKPTEVVDDEKAVEADTEEIHGLNREDDEHKLLSVQLTKYPPLKDCWEQQHAPEQWVSHETVQDRVNKLFKYRLSVQSVRANRMQERWFQLKEEAESVKAKRQENALKARLRSAAVESSIAKTPSVAPW